MFTEAATRRQHLVRRAIRRLDALATPHGIDRFVEQVVPTWSSTEVRGRVTAVAHPTADSVTLTIKPNGNWDGFVAGQHTQLSIEIDGVRHTRCYSMATAATAPGTFELTVKAHAAGTVSAHLKVHAAVGMVVGLAPAAGDFTLPNPRPARLLLISGGSGITPVLAMLRTLCAEGAPTHVTFVHYAKGATDVAYAAELAAIDAAHATVDVVTVHTRDANGVSDPAQRLTADQLDAIAPGWQQIPTYLCGPEALFAAAVEAYTEAGALDRLHTEAFTVRTRTDGPVETGGAVRFATSGVEATNDGRSLLEQAEAAGLAPTHGCRMGICHTCTATLTCGTVRNLVTGDETTAPDDGVAVRVCVNAPVGDVDLAI